MIPIRIKHLGIKPYSTILEQMQSFTENRNEQTLDEIWIVEHEPVYTQGQAGKPEHILHKTDIPIVQSDRGGQVTYHGPGQVILYPLLNLKRVGLDLKTLVHALEGSVIQLLQSYQLIGHRQEKAPGVYIDEQKVAFVGLKIRKGFCYHGISLNVDLDLSPFEHINPCGYPNLRLTQLREKIQPLNYATLIDEWVTLLVEDLGYTPIEATNDTPYR